jgi:hypothetical protein
MRPPFEMAAALLPVAAAFAKSPTPLPGPCLRGTKKKPPGSSDDQGLQVAFDSR